MCYVLLKTFPPTKWYNMKERTQYNRCPTDILHGTDHYHLPLKRLPWSYFTTPAKPGIIHVKWYLYVERYAHAGLTRWLKKCDGVLHFSKHRQMQVLFTSLQEYSPFAWGIWTAWWLFGGGGGGCDSSMGGSGGVPTSCCCSWANIPALFCCIHAWARAAQSVSVGWKSSLPSCTTGITICFKSLTND